MAVHNITRFLDQHGVFYDLTVHPQTFTTLATASVLGVRPEAMAKSVIVRSDEDLVMAVLPGTRQILMDRLRDATGARRVGLAREDQFVERFPDCQVGAMPPFGNLYDLPVYVDLALADDEEIVFNAGTHAHVIRMRFRDYRDLVQPTFVPLSGSIRLDAAAG